MTISYTKPPLTFQEQIDLLSARGLEIRDRDAAATSLSRVSYYRLSAYCLTFKGNDGRFHLGSTWEDVLTLYEFDRKLRLVVMDALERVEVGMRTDVTYSLAHAYGAFGHHAPSNFRASFQHQLWLDKLSNEVAKSHEVFIRHFKVKYDGFPRLPIWMESEVMSFGSLSRLYEGMQDVDQQKLAAPYGLPHYVLRSWLRSLNFIRNLCAHHSRLWNRELSVAPLMPKKKHGWPPQEIPNHKRLFAVLVMLNHLLLEDKFTLEWRTAVSELLEPLACKETYRVAMGLPERWRAHPRWNVASVQK